MDGAVPPKRIGSYEIIRELGRGGMGIVYQAHEQNLQRDVALKVLPILLADNPALVKRFYREARAAARLSHPNITPIYAVGEDNGTHFIAMEYVRGESLAQIIAREGQLELVRTLNILRQCADALDAAHQQGIIHRDIKPQNIMVDEKGRVRVMDFGLARIIEAATQLTKSGERFGTPHYMSPEQCWGSELDQRSDIFSLGVTLFEMVTGRRPFPGNSPLSVMNSIVNQPLPQASALRPGLPKSVEKIIEGMTAKIIYDRFESCAEVYKAVESALRQTSPFLESKSTDVEITMNVGDRASLDTLTANAAVDFDVQDSRKPNQKLSNADMIPSALSGPSKGFDIDSSRPATEPRSSSSLGQNDDEELDKMRSATNMSLGIEPRESSRQITARSPSSDWSSSLTCYGLVAWLGITSNFASNVFIFDSSLGSLDFATSQAILFGSTFVGILASGLLTEFLDGKLFSRLGLLLTVAGVIIAWIDLHFDTFYLGEATAGIGRGILYVVLSSMIAGLHPHGAFRRLAILSIVYSIGNSMWCILQLLSEVLDGDTSLYYVTISTIEIGIPVSLFFTYRLNSIETVHYEELGRERIRKLLARPNSIAVLIVVMMYAAIVWGIFVVDDHVDRQYILLGVFAGQALGYILFDYYRMIYMTYYNILSSYVLLVSPLLLSVWLFFYLPLLFPSSLGIAAGCVWSATLVSISVNLSTTGFRLIVASAYAGFAIAALVIGHMSSVKTQGEVWGFILECTIIVLAILSYLLVRRKTA